MLGGTGGGDACLLFRGWSVGGWGWMRDWLRGFLMDVGWR